MRKMKSYVVPLVFSSLAFVMSSCSQYAGTSNTASAKPVHSASANYASRLPQHISSKEKTVVVDPNVHAWGAYSNGELVRAGIATAGSNWCADIKRPCRTRSGTFRIYSLGSANCKSTKYPIPRGGAPMPYCMYFNGGQGLHGSGNAQVVEANVSHGCVRMRVGDAEWLRYNFVNVGTRVVVKPY